MQFTNGDLNDRLMRLKGGMLSELAVSINSEERSIHDEAMAWIAAKHSEEFHHLVSVALGASGKHYLWPHMNVVKYREASVCAEPGALMLAHMADDPAQTIVVVHGPDEENEDPYVRVPCGNCVMRIDRYAPDCWVIVDTEEEFIKAAVPAITDDLVKIPSKALMLLMYDKEVKRRTKKKGMQQEVRP